MMDFIEDRNTSEVQSPKTTEQVENAEGEIEIDLDTDTLTQYKPHVGIQHGLKNTTKLAH